MRIDRLKLIMLLAQKDMTCVRLAEVSGLSISTIMQVKGGKSCSFKTGYKIATALGTTVEDLEKGVDR